MPPKKTTPEHRSTDLRADLNIHAHAPPSPPETRTIRTAVAFGDVRVEIEIPLEPHDSVTLNHFQNGGPLQRLLDLVVRRESAAAEEKELANGERKIRLEAEKLRLRDSGTGITRRTTAPENQEESPPDPANPDPPRPARGGIYG